MGRAEERERERFNGACKIRLYAQAFNMKKSRKKKTPLPVMSNCFTINICVRVT